MSENFQIYPRVVDDIEDWPIYHLHEDRANFVKEIDDFTVEKLLNRHKEKISDAIAKTVYLERIRIKEEPWKVDPPNDKLFWDKLRRELASSALDAENEAAKEINSSLLRKIVNRYSEEIVGTFSKPIYHFAERFLTVFFNRLLNGAAGKKFKRLFGTRHQLHEKIQTKGEIDKVRSLMTKGSVIIVPTHFSNLDSLLIGFAMAKIVGLPSFLWGAGLNLYNTGYTAYFMNRLGAYRLDRRKKNPIYLETLKAMSSLAVQRGVNSLFFPGGTRSRSGKLEDKLKKGMLGTVVEAQREILQQGKEGKVFIVPVVLGYHVTLEAKFLIEQHLKITGKEHYIGVKDGSYSARKLLKFAWNFFSQPSEITLSFGKPMDVLGNFVDKDGNSFDKFGKPVGIEEYFMKDGVVNRDFQREMEYTNILANRIVERYHKENIVLTSHLIAFAAFNILKRENPKLDLYGLLRLPTEDYIFDFDLLKKVVKDLTTELFKMEKNGQIQLSRQIHWGTEELIKDGIRNMGIYHPEKPLIFNRKKELVSYSFKLLFYYHNRLENYDLHKIIRWKGTKENVVPKVFEKVS